MSSVTTQRGYDRHVNTIATLSVDTFRHKFGMRSVGTIFQVSYCIALQQTGML
jgi:hypothetical protein